MRTAKFFPYLDLWINQNIIFEFFVCSLILHKSLACQSIATVEISEHDARIFTHPIAGSSLAQELLPRNAPQFALNLTDLLMKKLQLTERDLSEPIFFADAEQSRPFLIQQQPNILGRNESVAFKRWYKLTSSVPLDREQLCSMTYYPERVSVASTCCAKNFDLPPEAVISTINNPCCIFLGITVASRGTYVLRVQILDVNDNAPKFGMPNSGSDFPYAKSAYGKTVIGISENTPAGSWIPVPTAVDSDEGLNGAIRYSIQSINDDVLWADYFKLLTNVHTAGLSVNSTSAHFVLNNQKSGTSFELTDYTGPGLLILKKLDREKFSSFGFNLVASDMGVTVTHSAHIHIRIVVFDENDNEPVFEKSTYHVEVLENQAGISLLHTRVQDKDADNNGRLTYHLQSSRLESRVAGVAGGLGGSSVSADFLRTHIQLVPVADGVTLRVIQPLDYEKQAEFNFDLIAVDHGQPALSATAHVHVTVINVNDHAPYIRFYYHGEPLDRDYARLSVFEQHGAQDIAAENQLICHVHVTDADTDFESIDCTVESTERIFYLREVRTNRLIQRSKIYELLTATRLDRERQGRLLVLVRCQDGKRSNSLVSQNQLQLVILDVNDHPPVFSQDHYHGTVSENGVNNLVVITAPDSSSVSKLGSQNIQATDADTGANALVFYTIVPWITNASDLNDQRMNNNTEDIHGKVGRTWNNSLEANKEKILNTTIHSVSSLWNPSKDAEKFYIDQTSGQIRTRIALDSEEQQIYRFFVLAVDQAEGGEPRYTATARVTVTVRDENDNPPVIEQRHYAFSVKEGLPRHTRIGQIHSTDADIGPDNQRTIYELKNVENLNASEFVQIETHTGVITTARILDREFIGQLSFVVLARNEQPAHEASKSRHTIPTEKGSTFYDEASVTITVEDENDNAPFMVRRTAAQLGTKGITSPSVVDLTFKVNANEQTSPCIEFPFHFLDNDEGPNGEIDVELEGNSLFELRLDNTLLCMINNEPTRVSQVNLIVTLRDKPLNKSKTLKRQYTVRVHFVDEVPPLPDTAPFDRINPVVFTASPANANRGDSTNPMAFFNPRASADQHRRSTDQTRGIHEIQYSDSHRRKPFASSSTTVTIVAILVAVSGLLCLLLLGMVFALKKATPMARHMSNECEPKSPEEEEDGDNSIMSGPRGDNHIYFTTSQSPASFQTGNSSDRFKPIPQAFVESKCSLVQTMSKLPAGTDRSSLLTSNSNLFNNHVRSWTPRAVQLQREFASTPGYRFAIRGLSVGPDYASTDGQSDISEDQKTALKTDYLTQHTRMHDVQICDDIGNARDSSSDLTGAVIKDAKLSTGCESPADLSNRPIAFTSQSLLFGANSTQANARFCKHEDNSREKTIKAAKDDFELYQRCSSAHETQTTTDNREKPQVRHNIAARTNREPFHTFSSLVQSRSTKNLYAQTSFV